MDKTLFEVLNSFSDVAEALKDKPMNKEFWKKQEEIWKELDRQSRKEQESIKMSWEKFNKPFDL